MSDPRPRTLGRPSLLETSGLSQASQDALLDLEQAFFQWHRKVLKGELTGRLLAESGHRIEPGQFHGLTAVARIAAGIGRDAPTDPTIGLLAEEMAIDPSRASRVAADLIAQGLVRREAAQDDGRKTVLRLTPEGRAVLVDMRDRKWQHFVRVFSGWSEDEIATFSRLFARYADEIMGEGAD
jgi:DNA-binding MarR family transcriptional regulator